MTIAVPPAQKAMMSGSDLAEVQIPPPSLLFAQIAHPVIPPAVRIPMTMTIIPKAMARLLSAHQVRREPHCRRGGRLSEKREFLDSPSEERIPRPEAGLGAAAGTWESAERATLLGEGPLKLIGGANDRFKDARRQRVLERDGKPLKEEPHRMAERGGARAHDLGHAAGDRLRRRAVLLIALHDAQGGVELLAIGGVPLGLLRPDAVGGEVRAVVAGLDEGDSDPEVPDLHPEGFAESFNGEFGRAVEGLEGNRDEAGDRAHVDDEARAFLAHAGEDGFGDPEHPEEVRVELRLGFLDRGFFGRAGDPVTGIIDERVDPSLGLLDAGDSLGDGT